jgi:DNA-binding PadR family transcriptional regulator
MNNENERFFLKNGEVIRQLTECLDVIVEKFESGKIPGDPEKSNAIYAVNQYLEAITDFKTKKQSILNRLNVRTSEPFEEKKAFIELAQKKHIIKALMRIGREKMILTDDPEMLNEELRILVDKGYCDEISISNGSRHYYILSEKGEQALRNKELLAKFRSEVSSAVMPATFVYEASNWTNLYLRRTEMIHKYFQINRNNVNHVIFTTDESKEMVFGCEIDNSVDVNYVFAGIFDERIEEHVEKIKNILNSGHIDQITILNSSDDGKIMLEQAGLEPGRYPQVQFEMVN